MPRNSFFQMSSRRYLILGIVLVISLHYILTVSHEGYSRASSFTNIKHQLGFQQNASLSSNEATPIDLFDPLQYPDPSRNLSVGPNGQQRANATFVFLARNNDLAGVVDSVRSMEDRFNRHYNYPWIFLNEEEFTDEFKKRVSVLTNAEVQFGVIPKHHWYQPDWVDENKAREGREKMTAQGIIYADSVSYRNMCRFNSGFFYHHPLVQQYRYYWRVEPEVKFFCDLKYDPFLYMQEHQKIYGFTISLLEWEATIPSLWSAVKEFMEQNPSYIHEQNSLDLISPDNGKTYNLCHFWSNFEIADMDFWRSEAYTKFFEHLESKGGFYYERWGDAPVHSIGAALFARKDQIHFFRDIGYRHELFQHCPTGDQWTEGHCSCDPNDTFDYSPFSCLARFESLFA